MIQIYQLDIINDLKIGIDSLSSMYRNEHRFFYNRRLSALVIWIEKEIQKENSV